MGRRGYAIDGSCFCLYILTKPISQSSTSLGFDMSMLLCVARELADDAQLKSRFVLAACWFNAIHVQFIKWCDKYNRHNFRKYKPVEALEMMRTKSECASQLCASKSTQTRPVIC